jgi:nitroreductase
MRTTFAARAFTNDPVEDEVLHRILDNARFAPSGGNRQGWRVLVIRDTALRTELARLMGPTIQQYKAQSMAGETPFNTIRPSLVSEATIKATSPAFPMVDDITSVPVVLVVCVDLSVVSSFDKALPRVGVISGASIYPFVHNLFPAARNEGLGGVLTTFLAHQEVEARNLLAIPDEFAIASMVALGKPVRQLTRLTRKPVSHFTRIDQWDGESFGPDT